MQWSSWGGMRGRQGGQAPLPQASPANPARYLITYTDWGARETERPGAYMRGNVAHLHSLLAIPLASLVFDSWHLLSRIGIPGCELRRFLILC